MDFRGDASAQNDYCGRGTTSTPRAGFNGLFSRPQRAATGTGSSTAWSVWRICQVSAASLAMMTRSMSRLAARHSSSRGNKVLPPPRPLRKSTLLWSLRARLPGESGWGGGCKVREEMPSKDGRNNGKWLYQGSDMAGIKTRLSRAK